MAAGLGFKTFTTGEVLTAGDVNGYLMQGVLVFATAAARNSAITSPQEGQFAFTKDTNGLWYYDGAAWVASGATGDIEGVTAGVGITGGGTSGTVTVTNDMATTITTAGDLIKGTGSGTYNRLGIGSNGQVLTVASGAPSWASASSGAMVLVKAPTTFTNVATTTTTFDGVFTSTYSNYIIFFEGIYAATSADDPQFQFRYGSTTNAANYFGNVLLSTGTSTSTTSNSNTNQFTFSPQMGSSSYPTFGFMNIYNVGSSSVRPYLSGTAFQNDGTQTTTFAGTTSSAQTHTGFILSSSSSNISGTVSVYGLVTA